MAGLSAQESGLKAMLHVHKMDAGERTQDISLHQDVPRLFISPDQEGSLLALIKSERCRVVRFSILFSGCRQPADLRFRAVYRKRGRAADSSFDDGEHQ